MPPKKVKCFRPRPVLVLAATRRLFIPLIITTSCLVLNDLPLQALPVSSSTYCYFLLPS